MSASLYPCRNSYPDVDFRTPNKAGKPRKLPGDQSPTLPIPPGPPGADPAGWCRVSPGYRDLPSNISPAIRAAAKDFFRRACYHNQAEVREIDGEPIAFKIEALYNDDGPEDYWYMGAGVYRQITPGAPFRWDPDLIPAPGTPSGTYPNKFPPSVTSPEQQVEYGIQIGMPCVTKVGPWAEASRSEDSLSDEGGSKLFYGVLAVGAAGALWYFLSNRKPGRARPNSRKKNLR